MAGRILAEIVEDIAEINIEHGADADKMAETDALLHAEIEDGSTNSSALRDKGQIPCCRHPGGEAGVKVSAGPNDAEAVRAHDTKPAGIGRGADLLLDLFACFADLLPRPK